MHLYFNLPQNHKHIKTYFLGKRLPKETAQGKWFCNQAGSLPGHFCGLNTTVIHSVTEGDSGVTHGNAAGILSPLSRMTCGQ